MTINDFPASVTLDLVARSQTISCRVRLAPTVESDSADVVRDVVKWFGQACSLGMLSGAKIDPGRAQLDVAERVSTADLLEFELGLTNIPANSCRVLIGMLRGQVVLDQVVTSVELVSRTTPDDHALVSSPTEQALPLPGLFAGLSFRYEREESMVLTDRGLRVTCSKPLSEDVVIHFSGIQAAWEAICDGGCCPDGVPAVECSMLVEPGVVIAPNVYEVKIGVFNNPEQCFDYFANAMERVTRTIQRVDVVEVW